ncbi:hypothetical protein ASD64_10720, partial [Mesorhizobium sp. Root157]
RTWGLITQPHTVMRPIRHRRFPSIPGAHRVSRRSDGTDYGRGTKRVDKGGDRFLLEVSRINGLAGEMGGR